jgi:protein-disulfide isomerase
VSPAGLSSAPVPAPGGADHVRGSGPEVILYLDLACPACAALWGRVRALPLRVCVRHFPLAGQRPRSPALHQATEAAARQSERAFWELWDSLLADPAHSDDPHLWARAEQLGLDLGRFERDRRSPEVAERVREDFRSGIRAGVSGTPAGFAQGRALGSVLGEALARLAGTAGRGL